LSQQRARRHSDQTLHPERRDGAQPYRQRGKAGAHYYEGGDERLSGTSTGRISTNAANATSTYGMVVLPGWTGTGRPGPRQLTLVAAL
jgi:hypothetical protein